MTKRLLHPLPGAVCKQWRAYKGHRLGPYYFRFWRENGHLRKEYVRQSRLDGVRRACAAHRQERQERREAMLMFKQISRLLRVRGL